MTKTILDLFEKSVDLYDGKVAVKDVDEAYTYGKLHEDAVNIGYALFTKLGGVLK